MIYGIWYMDEINFRNYLKSFYIKRIRAQAILRWKLELKTASKKIYVLKNEMGYRLMEENKPFWSVLILLLSVASIRRKKRLMLKPEERSVIEIQKFATFN